MTSQLEYQPGLGKSDHLVLNFNFNCYANLSAPTFKKYNFFKGKYLAIEQELNKEDWH